jgi:hypothetical protein
MINVTNSANAITISDDTNTNPTVIAKTKIIEVGMYWQFNCNNGLGLSPYAYGRRTPGRTTKTIVILHLNDGTKVSFDCDEVANQVTWQGCQQSDLLTAVADIKSWLP